MKLLCYLFCIIGATALIKIYNLHAARPLRNKRMWIAVALLTMFLAWGGEKPAPDPDNPDPPTPPTPDEPDVPHEPVENVRLKLIGRYSEGKFIPLTSEWVEVVTTNGVIETEQLKELINE